MIKNNVMLLSLLLICYFAHVVLADNIPEAIKQPDRKVNPKDSAELILIPAGDFLMGSENADKIARKDQKPQHKVFLDTYYIYKTEVTVAQYRKFCEETKRKMPVEPPWKWQDNHPILNITWDDAKYYADWAGVTLPTEAQWEKAARGTDGRIYPWGNEWDASKLQCSKTEWGDVGKTAPVGSFPAGASPYGVLDMAGNVWEWCADWYSPDYYKTTPLNNPTGPETKDLKEINLRVLHGGCWGGFNSDNFRVALRYYIYLPTNKYFYIGFRCVINSPQK